MRYADAHGLAFSGATDQSLAHLNTALHQLRCYVGDPVATVDAALESSPDLVMGHALRAYLHLLGTEPEALTEAWDSLRRARQLPVNDREQQHLRAVEQIARGRWREAGRTLEDLSIDYPLDALALQAGHLIDFYTGDSRMLRDRIARALPAWRGSMPGHHAVLGMHAFGLEECGQYAAAEKQGRRSVELEPRDGWAQHAVAHVMEMQGRVRDGIAWMRAAPEHWSHESFFAVHNWWHLALYHLELNEIDVVLDLFDGPIFGARSKVVLDLIDASALLWRLHLRGVDVGARWDAVADNWAPIATAGNYAFNDLHAMMAFVGAGRTERIEAVLQAQHAALQGQGDNVAFLDEVGSAATQAVAAFGERDYARAVALLRPIRHRAHRFGGSHAQRDLIDLTLLEAAICSGERSLAQAFAAERLSVKPYSPLARLFVERTVLPRAA